MITIDSEIIDGIVNDILISPKYRNFPVVDETVRDLVTQEINKGLNPKQAKDIVRKKLHNITASYLGDPDYSAAIVALQEAYVSLDQDALKIVCQDVMRTHISTRERLPFLPAMYEIIFSYTGNPEIILDLACGLHPLSIPWMGITSNTQYYAFDIHRIRVNFINQFLDLINMKQNAAAKDIIFSPPDNSADVAFIFKEIQRFEQRRQGCSYQLIKSLKSKFVVVSLPVQGMHSKHEQTNAYKNFFYKIIHSSNWHVDDFMIGNELFFCIRK